jgi:hypothetical protein
MSFLYVVMTWSWLYGVFAIVYRQQLDKSNWQQDAYLSRLGTTVVELAQISHWMNRHRRENWVYTYGKIQILGYHGLLSLETRTL